MNNKPNKILNIGDIHMFVNKRFEEHQHVFDNLYKLINEEKIDLIVLTGDILDSKGRLSANQIQLCREFLFILAGFSPLIILPGNHDTNLNNKNSLDSLTPIINSLENEKINKIYYLKLNSKFH